MEKPGLARALALTLVCSMAHLPGHGELIGFYSFDDAANPLADASGNGNTLTTTGDDPVYEATSGLIGGAYRYDGAQHLISPIDINPTTLGALTMGAWVRTTTLESALRKVMGHDDGGWDRTIGLDNRNGEFRYTAFTGSGPGPEELPGPRSTEDWTFVAATYDDGSSIMTVYVDVDANTVGDDLISVEVADAFFGLGQETTAIGNLRSDNTSEGWIGYIDNVFFFDEILTLEQLTTMRNQGTPDLSVTADPNFSAISVPDLSNLEKTPSTHDFSIPIRNDGASAALNISEVTVAGADGAYYTVRDFPNQLGAGQSGNIDLTLDSRGEVGAFNGVLIVVSDDSVQRRTTLDVSAFVAPDGTTDPALSVVTPDPVVGERGMSPSTVSIEIRNAGSAQPLAISSATVIGRDASNYTVNSFPETLAPGASGQISVTFDPRGEAKSFAAQLRISSTDAANRHTLIDLGALVRAVDIRPALIGFYPFDDPANPIRDESGNNNHLQEPTNPNATVPSYDAEGGIEGGAFTFDGTQLWVVPININPSAIPELTMGAWVKTASLDPGLRKVIGHDDGAWDRTIGLDNRNGDFRYVAFTGINSPGPLEGLPGPETEEQWTFIAATFNQTRSELTAYVDIDASTTTDPLVSASAQDSPFGPGFTTAAIGDLRPDGPSEGWIGSIDNVFFYNTILSKEQLTSIRNGGKAFILSGGTTPDRPEITDITASDTAVALTWTSVAGANYAIEYAETLPGTWSQIGTQASGGATTSFQDTDATRRGRPTGFYRVVIQP